MAGTVRDPLDSRSVGNCGGGSLVPTELLWAPWEERANRLLSPRAVPIAPWCAFQLVRITWASIERRRLPYFVRVALRCDFPRTRTYRFELFGSPRPPLPLGRLPMVIRATWFIWCSGVAVAFRASRMGDSTSYEAATKCAEAEWLGWKRRSQRIRRRQAVNLNSGFRRADGWPKSFARK